MPSTIVITGASGGIGRALAVEYAAPGVTLHLFGRDPTRLDAAAAAVSAKGGVARVHAADVRDAAAMAEALTAIDAATPIELLVANAGISAGTRGGGESDEQTRDVFRVNLDGVLNTVLPILGPMRARRRGQIAIMSSVAGFRGLAGAPAYCASKAAVRVWGEGLRITSYNVCYTKLLRMRAARFGGIRNGIGKPFAPVIGVSTKPGQTTLTRTPSAAASPRRPSPHTRTAAFEAQ